VIAPQRSSVFKWNDIIIDSSHTFNAADPLYTFADRCDRYLKKGKRKKHMQKTFGEHLFGIGSV
jgi:hypothetical protein